MDYVKLGQRIRTNRKLLGLSQKEVATRAGISLPFFGHIERGTRTASVETLVSIANVLGVSMDMLLQDSLDVMKHPSASDNLLSERSRSLLNDIIGVLHEHDCEPPERTKSAPPKKGT